MRRIDRYPGGIERYPNEIERYPTRTDRNILIGKAEKKCAEIYLSNEAILQNDGEWFFCWSRKLE